jgi:hypothetical protein
MCSPGALWCILIPKRCWKVVTTKSKKKLGSWRLPRFHGVDAGAVFVAVVFVHTRAWKSAPTQVVSDSSCNSTKEEFHVRVVICCFVICRQYVGTCPTRSHTDTHARTHAIFHNSQHHISEYDLRCTISIRTDQDLTVDFPF